MMEAFLWNSSCWRVEDAGRRRRRRLTEIR